MGADQVVRLEANPIPESGRVEFSWPNPGSAEVVLQQAADADFESPVIRYEGKDSASVITGLPEGTHYFRVGTSGSDTWSDAVEIEVAFVSRGRLYLLLGLGGIVVLATVGAIIGGHWRTEAKRGGGAS